MRHNRCRRWPRRFVVATFVVATYNRPPGPAAGLVRTALTPIGYTANNSKSLQSEYLSGKQQTCCTWSTSFNITGCGRVLKGISLEIDAGQLIVVVGPNGMGKTTLLGVMAGTMTPQRGYVEYDGLRTATRSRPKWPFAAASSSCPTIPGCPST